MYKFLINHIPIALYTELAKFKNKLTGVYVNKSYSQEGEDLVLARIFENLNISAGFFVDIGAHHPIRFSNTYYFYQRGWQGINVDALPGTKCLFERVRPRDITVECGVGESSGSLKYFLFNDPALNTFSEQEAKKKNFPPFHIIETLEVSVVTLKQILDQNLPKDVEIDFMTIDAEGFDDQIIASNDWNRYRPRIILIELLNTEILTINSHPIAQLLQLNNYRIYAKTFNTFFFLANELLLPNA